MLLIDPKKLEFEMYHGIPHLLYPVMTEPKEAAAALAWACREMDERYDLLARWGTRNIVGYNAKLEREIRDWTAEKARRYAPRAWTELDGPLSPPKKLPYIVIIIDELADLMMVAGKDVEESICRVAQKARACGIHLIVATQRPSVDVITGLIKANLPTRISFQLRTKIDSRTVLDSMGAEALLGRGDLLYLPPGVGNLMRCHGAFVSDEEVTRVTDYLRAQAEPEYIAEIVTFEGDEVEVDSGERDELYEAAVAIVVQAGKASTSMVQRHLKIGYNRAANIIEQMESAGVVGPADGARPRDVLLGASDL
jgi:S-DNA-T family DNA segregation ATPase FtsK/SpoIIIE